MVQDVSIVAQARSQTKLALVALIAPQELIHWQTVPVLPALQVPSQEMVLLLAPRVLVGTLQL